MAMDQALRDFPNQFAFEPVVANAEHLEPKPHVVVCGMGGSNLASSLLKTWKPEIWITMHRDYGLPAMPEDLARQTLFIASSYSGNTEETLSSYDEARAKGHAVAVVAVGGKLLDAAKRDDVAYIELPNTGIQPRAALGFSAVALMKLMGQAEALDEMKRLASTLQGDVLEGSGKKLASELSGHVPLFYASEQNVAIARIAKIKFNENTKIPAFFNALPEMNHNEMTGFDVTDATHALSEKFHIVLFRDASDHAQIQKRMDVVKQLYEKRGLAVSEITMAGTTKLEQMFMALLIADWASFYVGQAYGVEIEQVPMVEEFKKLIA